MDGLTFTAQIVAALAWPAALIVSVLLLRKLLAELVPLVRKLRYSDVELTFGKEVAELEDTAAAAGLRITTASSGLDDLERENLIRLAQVRPRSAIRGAWEKVESGLVKLAQQRNLSPEPVVWTMPMVLGALMLNSGIISEAQYDLLSRLRELKSEAERAPVDSLNAEDAASVVEHALSLAGSLARGD